MDVDVVFQGISSGMGILAAYSGFQQLYEAKVLRKMPRIVCVQQDTCSPMVKADAQNYDEFPDHLVIREPDGIAKAILRGNPKKSYTYVRNVVRKTDGCFCSVSQDEIINALAFLNTKNIPACPTSACTLAAFRKLARQGWLDPSDRSLLLLTGGVLE